MHKAWTSIGFVLAAVIMAGCGSKDEEPIDESPAAADATVASGGKATVVTHEAWDKLPDGTPVTMWELTDSTGMKARVIDWGATLIGLDVPDRDGKLADVVLGFDKVEPYMGKSPYMGSTVGRYANRIALGKFTLDGKEYSLATNNAPNHLHGGNVGYDKVMWKGKPFKDSGTVGVVFTHTSPDGDEGYPGTVEMKVTISLRNTNDIWFEYEATTDKATPLNLTNHAYWNLAGASSGVNILNHVLMIQAEKYTPTDDTFIPTGEIAPVKDTPVDFREPHAIAERIAQIPGTPGGYDHNFVLDQLPNTYGFAAEIKDAGSGRVMKVYTSEPGLQFYTGNFLDGTLTGKGGTVYQMNMAFCLEAQKFPDSPNKPDFPTSILRPGEKYKQTTVHRFSVE